MCIRPHPNLVIKTIGCHIAPIICHLCNLSLEHAVFPTQLEQARVLPLLKKPTLDPDEACSYRPISNLSYLSKLSERVVASLNILPLTICCRCSSPPIDLSTQLKQLSCPSTTTLSALLTTAKYLFSCSSTSVRLSTPLIISCSCQYWPTDSP